MLDYLKNGPEVIKVRKSTTNTKTFFFKECFLANDAAKFSTSHLGKHSSKSWSNVTTIDLGPYLCKNRKMQVAPIKNIKLNYLLHSQATHQGSRGTKKHYNGFSQPLNDEK